MKCCCYFHWATESKTYRLKFSSFSGIYIHPTVLWLCEIEHRWLVTWVNGGHFLLSFSESILYFPRTQSQVCESIEARICCTVHSLKWRPTCLSFIQSAQSSNHDRLQRSILFSLRFAEHRWRQYSFVVFLSSEGEKSLMKLLSFIETKRVWLLENEYLRFWVVTVL